MLVPVVPNIGSGLGSDAVGKFPLIGVLIKTQPI